MRSLDELDVRGRRVLVRVDFNVPLGTGPDGVPIVADDTRIRAALPTIEDLRARGARLILVSHLGRPDGLVVPELSLAPVVARLCKLTDAPVTLAPAVVGAEVKRLSEGLADGEILVLENSRFEPGETANDPELARALADLADVYVNDAFGAAHRAHASTEGVAHLLPSAAGRLLEREVKTLGWMLDDPAHPLVAVLGGAKVADKIAVIERFLGLADALLIGGAMCFPFLAAEGHAIGASLCAADDVEHARRVLARAADCRPPGGRPAADAQATRLCLPRDLVIGERLAADAPAPGARRRGGAPRLDGSRHRPRHRGALRRGDRRRGLDLLERADGRVRAGAVRRRHARRRRGGGRRCGHGRGRGRRLGAALAQFGLENAVDYLSTAAARRSS